MIVTFLSLKLLTFSEGVVVVDYGVVINCVIFCCYYDSYYGCWLWLITLTTFQTIPTSHRARLTTISTTLPPPQGASPDTPSHPPLNQPCNDS